MRVLVVGGTNFLGPPLVRRLVALGHEVAVFHRGRTGAELPPAVEHKALDTDSGRIRRELGFVEVVTPGEALERTVAWERANPPERPSGLGLLDYDAEDALLAELRG